MRLATTVMLVATFGYVYWGNRRTWRERETGRSCLPKFAGSRLASAVGTWLLLPQLARYLPSVQLGSVTLTSYDQANTACVALATGLNFAACKAWVFTPWVLPPAFRSDRRARPPRRGWHRRWCACEDCQRHRQRIALDRAREVMVAEDARLRRLGIGGWDQRAEGDPAASDLLLLPWLHGSPPPTAAPQPRPRPRRRHAWRLPRLPLRLARALKGTALALAALLTAAGTVVDAHVTLTVLLAAVATPLTLIGWRSLLRTWHRWETPWLADPDLFRLERTSDNPAATFDFTIAARKEKVLYANLRRIMRLARHYPDRLFRVYVGIAGDDPETVELARQAQREFGDVIQLVIVGGEKRSKPITLNQLLPRLSAQWQCTLDAESEPAPELLSYVDAFIQLHPDAGVIQMPVGLMNPLAPRRLRPGGGAYPRLDPRGWRWGSWWRGHNCLEYQLWFRSVVAHQATKGFLTFGGNSIFIRRELLEMVGGWPEMLTEDAALGMRMSKLLQELELRIYTVYLPKLVTREQTPLSLRKWIVQRIRWLQGFMEVKQLGDWRALPTVRQRLLAWETLSMPAFQAVFGVTVPLALITGVTFKAPVPVVMWTYVPMVLMLLYASVLWAVFRDFCRAFGMRVSVLYMVRFALTLPLYQLMLSIAAIGAKVRQLRGRTNWVVTEKSGEHFTAELEQADEVLAGAY